MNDFLLPLQKIKIAISRLRIFDIVIILTLLNLVAITLIVFYFKKLESYSAISAQSFEYLPISSISLPKDLNSINASASAYVVYDASQRQVVAGKNYSLRFSPASTAKVMSAILAVEHYQLDQNLTVPFNIYSVVGSKMNLVAGEQVSVRSLIYGMMLPSGNDAAYVIAYYYPGGYEGFVNAMNEKAKSIGLVDTKFLDPAGYEDGNYTTAEELARLGAYALNNPFLAEVVRTSSIELNNTTNTHTFYLKNLNELLVYEDVVGIKTGFTNEAGGVLLTALKRGDKTFVVSVLKSPDRFADTKDIMNFIYEKVAYSEPSRP